MPHANSLEFVWIVIATISAVIALMSTIDARRDYFRWRTGTPQQRFMTEAIYIGSKWTLWLHVIVLFGAIWGGFHPPPPPPMSRVPQTHMWMFLGILLSLSKIMFVLYGRRIRRRMSRGDYNGH